MEPIAALEELLHRAIAPLLRTGAPVSGASWPETVDARPRELSGPANRLAHRKTNLSGEGPHRLGRSSVHGKPVRGRTPGFGTRATPERSASDGGMKTTHRAAPLPGARRPCTGTLMIDIVSRTPEPRPATIQSGGHRTWPAPRAFCSGGMGQAFSENLASYVSPQNRSSQNRSSQNRSSQDRSLQSLLPYDLPQYPPPANLSGLFPGEPSNGPGYALLRSRRLAHRSSAPYAQAYVDRRHARGRNPRRGHGWESPRRF
jgi:hypothetical protein